MHLRCCFFGKPLPVIPRPLSHCTQTAELPPVLWDYHSQSASARTPPLNSHWTWGRPLYSAHRYILLIHTSQFTSKIMNSFGLRRWEVYNLFSESIWTPLYYSNLLTASSVNELQEQWKYVACFMSSIVRIKTRTWK